MIDRTVFVECPACGGERGWESAPRGIDRRDGSLITDWITCRECDATGSIEVPVDLVEYFDLDEMTPPIETYEAA